MSRRPHTPQDFRNALLAEAFYATPDPPSRSVMTVVCFDCGRMFRVATCYLGLFEDGCPVCHAAAFADIPDLRIDPDAPLSSV